MYLKKHLYSKWILPEIENYKSKSKMLGSKILQQESLHLSANCHELNKYLQKLISLCSYYEPHNLVILWYCRRIIDRECTKIRLELKVKLGGQNDLSRAFRWGIIYLCKSNSIRDTIKNRMSHFSKIFLRFCIVDTAIFFKNAKNWKIQIFIHFSEYRDIQCLILKLLTYPFDL